LATAFAFGVAGGDTASALAAGCPVVAKAHPSNAGTSALVAAAVTRTVTRLGLPEGTFTLLQGAGHEVGSALVAHPQVSAVGFTGSLRGGRALADLAAARPEPIPVHAEMGSQNPVWITPAALAARGVKIAQALAASATLGVGQFCTKPSVVFVPPDANAFVHALCETVAASTLGPMLDARIAAHFVARRADLVALTGVTDATAVRTRDARGGVDAGVLVTDLTTWSGEPLLREECFGPLIVVVRCRAEALVDAVAVADDPTRLAFADIALGALIEANETELQAGGRAWQRGARDYVDGLRATHALLRARPRVDVIRAPPGAVRLLIDTRQVMLSTRRGAHVIPKYLFGITN
jgi:NADP-dependent aldehyde dehydrogenase